MTLSTLLTTAISSNREVVREFHPDEAWSAVIAQRYAREDDDDDLPAEGDYYDRDYVSASCNYPIIFSFL